MTWLNPAAFAFLALIPVVLLLHALRYRRREVRISTLFLWESVLREAHGSLGLQRLVQNLPLLLQLLLVCVLTAALANPVLTNTVATNKDIVLVLDVSASMQTRPTDAPGNMRDAILLALSFTQGSGTQEVVIVGDGAYGERLDIDMQ